MTLIYYQSSHEILPLVLLTATRDPSNLLAHEAAFALGQMQDADAIPALEAVLNDLSLHPIVRHEVRFVVYFQLNTMSCRVF